MKNVLAVVMVFCLTIMSFEVYGQAEETATQAPPVSQPLVSEGDFALKLAIALKLGTAATEAEAEDMLSSVGIAPKNGWIADYPMTPIIVGEVQNAVAQAAASNKLPMGNDEALQAFQGVTTELGLAIMPTSGQYAESLPPTSTDYVQPTVINNYYYQEGPPVVTYYPPPWDYYYLYAWVPYPFYCSGFFFSGYFVLNDFDYVGHHFHHGHDYYHRITNHFRDPRTHAFSRLDPRTGGRGSGVDAFTRRTHELGRGGPGFATPEARRGASSIFNRSFETARSTPLPGSVRRSYERAVPPTGNGRTLGQSGNSGGHYQNFQAPFTRGDRSINTPRTRSFSRPSVGANGGASAPPVRSFSRPFEGQASGGSVSVRSRSLSSPPIAGRSSFGSFRNEGFGSSGSTLNAPSRSSSGPSEGMVRPSIPQSRSYSAPPTASQSSFGSAYGRGFVSSGTTLSSPSTVNRGSFGGFNGGSHNLGGFSGGGFQGRGGSFHGGGRGR